MLKRRALSHLITWKDKTTRKPLIIRGARQVGKTSLVTYFGQTYFQSFIKINLEQSKDFELFSQVKTVEDFEKVVEVSFGQQLNSQTLLFIDEIQQLPHLVSLLRFFYEERPQYPVISAGSLFEASLSKAKISMPVGRVEFLYLYPLDFGEFLVALDEDKLLAELQSTQLNHQLPLALHDFALDLFSQYTWLGGMPELVKLYSQQESLEKLFSTYEGLLTTYQEDTFKYESMANSKYLKFAIANAPRHAGQLITYENFGQSQYRSREMSEAFDTLEKVMLLNQIQSTQSRTIPLLPKPLRSKKLIFLDVGLVNYQHRVSLEEFKHQQLEDVYRGRLAEQVVGQNLLAQATFAREELYYWSRPAEAGSAEVDFCFNHRGKIVGLEVKAGQATRLRSLFSFAQLVENAVLVRVYSGELKKEEINIAGEAHPLLSVPFYLIGRLKELIE